MEMCNQGRDNAGERIDSIDALRGFDMFWIIGGGGIFASLDDIFGHPVTAYIKDQLRHVQWEGFRFEDLIMPLFLFIVGVVMPFSFSKRLLRGQRTGQLYRHIIVRTVVLFVLGMVAQGNLLDYDLSTLHIFCNTLQAIAAGYLIASIVILALPLVGQFAAMAGLLILFCVTMTLFSAPVERAAMLTPDGNLAIYIDHLILGRFQDGTHYTWILSSMTFGATVLLGALAGSWLGSRYSGGLKTAGLAAAGIVCLALGYLWGWYSFAIVKHLWTSSFVLVSGGYCLLLLAVFYLVIDVWGLKGWAFGFRVIGLNAIAVYMATQLFSFGAIANIFISGFDKWLGNWSHLVHSTAAFLVVWLILLWMYRKKTFIKI
jgi:predicted acyltransferase